MELDRIHLIEPCQLALRLHLKLLCLLRRHVRVRLALRLRLLLRLHEFGIRLIDHCLDLRRILLDASTVDRTDMHLTAARREETRGKKDSRSRLIEIFHL